MPAIDLNTCARPLSVARVEVLDDRAHFQGRDAGIGRAGDHRVDASLRHDAHFQGRDAGIVRAGDHRVDASLRWRGQRRAQPLDPGLSG